LQHFNDFSHNQLTKFRIYWLISDSPPPSNLYEPSRFVDAPDRHNGQTNKHSDVSL